MLVPLVLLALLFISSVSAVDPGWKFRSDDHNTGVYDSGGILPGNREIWRYPSTMGGFLGASPTVVDDTVFIGGSMVFQAIDANTGAKKWEFQHWSMVDSAPAVSNGVVFFGAYDGYLYALDAKTGTLKWKSEWLGCSIQTAPTLAGGRVYVGSCGRFYAFNADSGQKIWTNSDAKQNYLSSSPAYDFDTVIVGNQDKNLYSFNVQSGTKYWNFPTSGVIFSSPAIANKTVYIGSEDHTVYALDMITGAEKWHFTTGGPVWSSPAVASRTVYIGSDDHSSMRWMRRAGRRNGMLLLVQRSSRVLPTRAALSMWEATTTPCMRWMQRAGVRHGALLPGERSGQAPW